MKGNSVDQLTYTLEDLLYFFGYKTKFFSFLNTPKNLDPSYDGSRSLGLFRKGKTLIIAKFHGSDLVICIHFGGGEKPVM